MAYTSANGTTDVIATDFHQGAQGGPQVKIDATLRTAERIVADLAPRPDPLPDPDDYTQAASDSELFIFEFLATTKGFVSSQSSIVSVSISYQNEPKVLQIIRDSMGEYVKDKDGIGELSIWPR